MRLDRLRIDSRKQRIVVGANLDEVDAERTEDSCKHTGARRHTWQSMANRWPDCAISIQIGEARDGRDIRAAEIFFHDRRGCARPGGSGWPR